MHHSKNSLLFLLLIFMIGGCNPLNSLLETSTPVFPMANQFESLPTLGPEITLTSPPIALETQEPQEIRSALTTTPHARTLIPDIDAQISTPDYDQLAPSIERITDQAGGRWHIIIKQIEGPTLYASLPDQRINIASVVKVPVALLFFKAIESNGVNENQLQDYLQSKGTGGRTFDQLLRAMLVKSEEDATEILDDRETHAQAESRTLSRILGGEERMKHLFHLFR